MNMKTEINLADFLDADELKSIAVDVAKRSICNSLDDKRNVERVVNNAAWDVVGEKVKAALGKDMEDAIVEETKKLATNEQSLRFALFRDDREYGGNKIGVALQIAENHVRQSCVERIHSVVDKVLDKINFNTKKFEQMVMKEAARMVAEKMLTKK